MTAGQNHKQWSHVPSYGLQYGSYLHNIQLRWAGHMLHVDYHCIPKQFLYGMLNQSKRHQGGQHKCHKETLKKCLKDCNINKNTWQQLEGNWSWWKASWELGLFTWREIYASCMILSGDERQQATTQPTNHEYIPRCQTCVYELKCLIGLHSNQIIHSGCDQYTGNWRLRHSWNRKVIHQ